MMITLLPYEINENKKLNRRASIRAVIPNIRNKLPVKKISTNLFLETAYKELSVCLSAIHKTY